MLMTLRRSRRLACALSLGTVFALAAPLTISASLFSTADGVPYPVQAVTAANSVVRPTDESPSAAGAVNLSRVALDEAITRSTPAQTDPPNSDPVLAITGWGGSTKVDGATKRPKRVIAVSAGDNRTWILQTKSKKTWQDVRDGVIKPGQTKAKIRLPADWYTRSKSAWRLVFPATEAAPEFITKAWRVTRTPAYKKVDCAVKRCVALTFDDGPGPMTPQLLDTLKKRKVPVTFFVLGVQVNNYPGTVNRAVREGHQVESHTVSHPNLNNLSSGAIASQLSRNAKIIEQATGIRPHLLRPPYGNADGHVLDTLKTTGWPAIYWTVDTRDWESRSPARIRAHVQNDTHNGSIILMHDIQPASIAAINSIISDLRRRGYKMVTLDTLLGRHLKSGKVYYQR